MTLFLIPLANPSFSFGEIDSSHLIAKSRQLAVACKTYQLPGDEGILLYGASDKKRLGENWYWGPQGYAAIGGQRSGYLEGGIMLGWQSRLIPDWGLDLRLFGGAGGGGSAPQGGGCLINPTVTLTWRILNALTLGWEMGYIEFINGDITSPTLGLTIGIDYQVLTYAP